MLKRKEKKTSRFDKENNIKKIKYVIGRYFNL